MPESIRRASVTTGRIVVRTLVDVLGFDRKQKTAGPTLAKSSLESFPVPVFEKRADGAVVCHNQLAENLNRSVDIGSVPGVVAALQRSRLSGRSQVEVVVIPGESGDMLYEMNVMPLIHGGCLILARDVTLESNLRSALLGSRQRYKDLVEISSDFTWEVDADGIFIFVSPRGALGHPPERLVGKPAADLVVEQPGSDGVLPFVADHPIEDAEVWIRRSDGDLACLSTSSAPLFDALGNRQGARGICRDITRERERDAALARANNRERLLTYIMRTVRDVVDPNDMLQAAAEATARALGATGCEIFRCRNHDFNSAVLFGMVGDSTPALAAFSSGDVFETVQGPYRVLGRVSRYRKSVNGAITVWRAVSGLDWSDDDRMLLDGVANQIGIANEQIANHERILALSRTDSLTELFNRRAFFEDLSRRFARLERDRKPAALIYLDLDNFKMVNDLFGHRRGDEALLAVRDILLNHVRPSDLVARLGGDEFAVWLEGAEENIAIRRCHDISEAAKALAPYSGDKDNPLTLSMGVAVHNPDRPELLTDLLSRADEAMYAAKRDGKSAFRLAPPTPPGGRP